ncbi:hypothetical protein G6F22_021476 [Rhizopus arrhizus]|nr:hypothetical protein G6F22_021476 [Rhizopus arrhizus]
MMRFMAAPIRSRPLRRARREQRVPAHPPGPRTGWPRREWVQARDPARPALPDPSGPMPSPPRHRHDDAAWPSGFPIVWLRQSEPLRPDRLPT